MSRGVKKRRRNDKTHSMEGLAKRRCVRGLPFLRLQIGLQGFGNPRFWSSVFGGPILLGGGAFCVVPGRCSAGFARGRCVLCRTGRCSAGFARGRCVLSRSLCAFPRQAQRSFFIFFESHPLIVIGQTSANCVFLIIFNHFHFSRGLFLAISFVLGFYF